MVFMANSDGLHNYDRLRDIAPEREFNFKCSSCQSNNIVITPVNIPYRMPEQPHATNDDLPLDVRSRLNRTPFIQKACIMANEASDAKLVYECVDCHMFNTINDKCNRLNLRRYLLRQYGSEPLQVGDVLYSTDE